MHKILINGRFLCRRPTGVDRFAVELLRVLDQWRSTNSPEIAGLDLEIIVPSTTSMRWMPQCIPVLELPRFDGHAWEQLTLARHLHGHLLLSLCNTGPLFSSGQIVAIHDATPVRVPASFSWTFRTLYRIMMPILGRTARLVLTVSDFSKREIVDCYGICPEKIRVIPNSGEQINRTLPDYSVFDRLALDGRRFALAVSTQAKHKNLNLLLAAVEGLDTEDFVVVLAGGVNERVFGPDNKAADARILRTGFVSDGELRALYERASCFVFPSLYEGFGIPPLEAMKLGCPVISSDASAMPEVLSDAALYVSPNDAIALREALRQVMTDSQLRENLALRGFRQAEKYSWANSARLLIGACREALAAEAFL